MTETSPSVISKAASPSSVGASLVLVTVILKVSEPERLPISLAVSLILITPTSPLSGVPLNVSVSPSNWSHSGKPPFSNATE